MNMADQSSRKAFRWSCCVLLVIQSIKDNKYLEAQDFVVAFPGDILRIAGKECGKARQNAEAMTAACSPAGFTAIACYPGAKSLYSTEVSTRFTRMTSQS